MSWFDIWMSGDWSPEGIEECERYDEECKRIKLACERAETDEQIINALGDISLLYDGWYRAYENLSNKNMSNDTRSQIIAHIKENVSSSGWGREKRELISLFKK